MTGDKKASPQVFQTQEGPSSKNQFFNHIKKSTTNTSFNNNPNRPPTARMSKDLNRYINSHQNFDNPVDNSYNTVEQGIYQRQNTGNSKLKVNRNSRGQDSTNRTNESQLKEGDTTSPYANLRQNNDGKKIKAHLLYENGSTKHILKDLVHKVSSNLYYDFSKKHPSGTSFKLRSKKSSIETSGLSVPSGMFGLQGSTRNVSTKGQPYLAKTLKDRKAGFSPVANDEEVKLNPRSDEGRGLFDL